jgi:uncharacterized membrane protein
MGVLNLVCWAIGVVLIVVGYTQARGPWGKYQQLKSQEANISRYEGWRGTRLRDDGPSAASIMAQEMRDRVRLWGAVLIVGFVLVFVGFAVH